MDDSSQAARNGERMMTSARSVCHWLCQLRRVRLHAPLECHFSWSVETSPHQAGNARCPFSLVLWSEQFFDLFATLVDQFQRLVFRCDVFVFVVQAENMTEGCVEFRDVDRTFRDINAVFVRGS